MKMKSTLALAALAAVGLTACSESPNEGQTGYSLELKIGQAPGKTASVAVNSGWAIVNQVELENWNDSADTEVDVEGAYTFDLITGVSSPVFPIAEIPTGVYNELEIGLWQNTNDTSMYVEATYTDSAGTDWPVILTVTESIGLEIEDDLNGIVIDTNTVNQLAVYWDIATILEGAGLDSATIDGGILRLDEANNEVQYEHIVEALNIEIEVDDND